MKRTIRILSYIGLAIATATFILLFANGIPLPSSNNTVALAKPFNDFPTDKPQFIDFRLDELSFRQLTDREKQDQLRDWLLFTITSDKDLSVEEINQSLYDVSTTRQGYMRPVSNFEYGTTRSLYVGDGEVVALIPAKLKAAERTDALAHIADKHRKNLGEKPKNLVVFEYELHPTEQYAWLTRREAIDATNQFTASAGYTESTINGLADFQSFMKTVDDLTFAQLNDESLILGGRKIQGQPYKGIRVEDVAAIWQSEEKIRANLAAFKAEWNAKLNAAPSAQHSLIEDQARAEAQKLRLVDGSGFSLDPAYDYESLFEILNAAESGLKNLRVNGERAISDQAIQNAKQALNPPKSISNSNLSSIPFSSERLKGIGSTKLLKRNIVPYLEITEVVRKVVQQAPQQVDLTSVEVDHVNALLHSTKEQEFQAARYDGELQGTETGMVLFYTDLLAKLWALDFKNNTPQREIPDFAPLTQISSRISSIYKQEIENLSNTRLWFGPQDKGFQALENNSLLFARNATRIYAASSNSLRPGEESIASANSEAFLGWWNDHYEEVAAYEPQYERLNEIMKWSLLVSWLNNAEQGTTLSFLKDVQVQRDFWFPDWAKAQGDRLRFKDWKSINFHPKGYLGTTTEAMEILQSESYTFFGNPNWRISGGVSLADEGLFQGRKAFSSIDDLDSLAYRSTLDYGTVQLNGDQLNFKTLEGTAYRLFKQQPTLASVATKAKEGSKLRGRSSELANLEFVRDIARTDDGLSINTFAGKTELGQLKTTRTGNGFDVGWRGRDIDEGQLLVQQINQISNQSIESMLKNHPMVALVAQSGDGKSFLIKLHDSDDWMQVASGGGGSKLPPEWQARVGSFADDSGRADSNKLMRWVDDEQVQKQLTEKSATLVINNLPDDMKVLNPNELIQTLKQRNYKLVAQQIADDPQRIHAIARDHIRTKLKIVNTLRQQKQPARALQHLDELINLYGRQPDLMLQKALLDMDRRRLSVRRIDPNGGGIPSAKSQEDFYDVINQILNSSDHNRHFKVSITDDEVVYVQDSPGFNNVDPSTPIDDAFPFGSEARAYRVESGSIGNAHIGRSGYDQPVPAVLTSADTGSPNTFNLSDYANVPGGSGSEGEDCKDPKNSNGKKQCSHQVYVVVDGTTL